MNTDASPTPQEEKSGLWAALRLSWELGYAIAIPIVVLALGGRLLDKKFGTSPIFLLLGVAVSIIATTIWLTIKAKAMIAEIEAQFPSKEAPTEKRL